MIIYLEGENAERHLLHMTLSYSAFGGMHNPHGRNARLRGPPHPGIIYPLKTTAI